jgi:hypothetical protein
MEIRAPQATAVEAAVDVVKRMTLFAQEVMPRVQARLGQKPSLAAVS